MEKPARTVNPYLFNLGMILLGVALFAGWNWVGYQLVRTQEVWIQWQTLPPPPSPIAELLPPWGRVRLLGADGNTYSMWADGNAAEQWEIEENAPPIANEEMPLSLCNLDDIPFSYSLTSPESSQQCYPYRIGPHSPNSYVVRDEQGQLWIWVNALEPFFNIIYLCLIGVSGFFVVFLILFWLSRRLRPA